MHIMKVSENGVQDSGLQVFPISTIIRYSKEHSISDIVSVSVQSLRLALSNGPNRCLPPPSPEDGNRYSFRNGMFFRIPDD
jgi:hypothetical protein